MREKCSKVDVNCDKGHEKSWIRHKRGEKENTKLTFCHARDILLTQKWNMKHSISLNLLQGKSARGKCSKVDVLCDKGHASSMVL